MILYRRRAKKKVSKSRWGGWATPIFTNAFLDQIKNILENLLDAKVLYVTKGCLKNLARAKNEMRVQKVDFWSNSFCSPPDF